MDEFPDLFLEKLEQAHYYDAGYIVALCIFHPDTRPSLFIYPDKFHCASCGKWGDTSDLAKRLDDLHFIYHKPLSYGYNPWTKWLGKNTLSKVIHVANTNLPIKYISDRKIPENVQRQLRLGQMDGWVTFPIFNSNNKIIGAVARAGEDNPSKSKYVLPFAQNPNLLYVTSWDKVTKSDRIYVTFGILDAVTLYAAGFASASTTTGKRIFANAFDNIRKAIIIIPDLGEEPEALKLASKLGWRGKVIQLRYPSGAKDLNDMVWKAGIKLEELKEWIKE